MRHRRVRDWTVERAKIFQEATPRPLPGTLRLATLTLAFDQTINNTITHYFTGKLDSWYGISASMLGRQEVG